MNSVLDFSVLMSVYLKENPSFLNESLKSIWDDQILKPTEIVIVKDGLLTKELDLVISDFQKRAPVKVLQLEKNSGLGVALAHGLNHCTCEIVARMDSDDISDPSRFNIQIGYLNSNPEVILVGSNLLEFISVPGDLNRNKKVPEFDYEIKKYIKYRSPFNHPSVVFRKERVLNVGSYCSMHSFEDYYLWFRLLNSGGLYYNFQESLVYFRVGSNLIGRRRGLQYALNEYKLFHQLRNDKIISNSMFIFLIAIRIPLRFLPNKAISFVYRFFLRD